jgi:hypothetical protein
MSGGHNSIKSMIVIGAFHTKITKEKIVFTTTNSLSPRFLTYIREDDDWNSITNRIASITGDNISDFKSLAACRGNFIQPIVNDTIITDNYNSSIGDKNSNEDTIRPSTATSIKSNVWISFVTLFPDFEKNSMKQFANALSNPQTIALPHLCIEKTVITKETYGTSSERTPRG